AGRRAAPPARRAARSTSLRTASGPVPTWASSVSSSVFILAHSFTTEPVSANMVREQIRVLAKNFPIGAIKTGLLCSAEIISTVAKAIVDLPRKLPLVVDPVITATGGDSLL